MILNYNNLWKLLIDRKITKTEMRNASGISTVTLAKRIKPLKKALESVIVKAAKKNCWYDPWNR